MTTTNQLLDSIPDSRPVRVFFPLLEKKERFRLNGVYEKGTPPHFTLLFKAGLLPIEQIDNKQPCIITVDMGGPAISLEAMIGEVTDEQKLQMIAAKSISHEQMREFFRVDAITSVIGSSFQPELFPEEQPNSWMLPGRTIDISGSGLLATFTERPPDDRHVRLEITLPNSSREKIVVMAHPVRVLEIHSELFEVAYHFDDILPEDRDKIIGCCLIIQRQMLRLRTQVRNATVL